MLPAEASELEGFVPPSLANVAGAPVFKLRPATKREMRSYRYAMDEEGIQYHQQDEMRAEVLRALRKLYSPDQYEAAKTSLTEFWTMVDQKIEPTEERISEVNELVARLITAWKPLSRMTAENKRFIEESLRIALSLFLVGWSNFDLGFRLEMGRCPLDLIDEVEDMLRQVERQAIADKVDGVSVEGIAFLQLCTAAQARMNLSKAEEKNSESPPSSPPTPNGSMTKSSSKTAGARSKASASSGSKKG